MRLTTPIRFALLLGCLVLLLSVAALVVAVRPGYDGRSLQESRHGSHAPLATPFKRVGYVDAKQPIGGIDWTLVTHVNVLYTRIERDGQLVLDSGQNARRIVGRAHAAGAHVLLTLGARSREDWVTAVGVPATRSRVVKQAVRLVESYGFDGIDIDLEVPEPPGHDDGVPLPPGAVSSSAIWDHLVLELSSALHARDRLVTAAVTSGVVAVRRTRSSGREAYVYEASIDGRGVSPAAIRELDWINVMVYDGQWSLDRDPRLHSPYSMFVASWDYWRRKRHVAARKIVLGIPFYAVHAGETTNRPYRDLVRDNPGNATADHMGGWWYNGIPTVTLKARFARSEGAGGVMLFHLGADTPRRSTSLLRAIYETAN